LLSLGSDGEFVLSLALFKMVEALEIKDIDTMIRGLENELKGVEVSEIMVSSPVADLSAPPKVITITEEEITASLPPKQVKVKKEETIQPSSTETSQEKEEKTTVDEKVHTENETQVVPQESIQEEPVAQTEISTPEPKPIQEETPVKPTPDPHQKTFDALVKKIYDRNYDLGACFERNISFESFKENKLTWGSTVEGDEKKMLINHWGLINMFVKDTFGFETKIVNIAKKKVADTSTSLVSEVNKVSEPAKAPHSDADVGSMIEDIEMKSSCISPEAGDTEAAKEKDPSTLLEEPMIKEAIAIFDPKKVRIKRNT
jgi:DNA polymerase-3 subunit gamma/tau